MSQVFRVEQVASSLLPTTSFQVAAGECLCISGPSGAGKSLLLRSLADLDVHSGKVFLGDKESHELKPHNWRRQGGAHRDPEDSTRDVTSVTTGIHGHMPDSQTL